ncbi:hypothetical protein A5869_001522 [Enterococcus cecorum]|uniref:Uncharacterized protein n=1 Tax=Enterococcus cecorum TaxID=44008 RepID=A0A200I134_9ENTE|nr:hypothetical protein A5869_001522 [Enterococcus cecorum]
MIQLNQVFKRRLRAVSYTHLDVYKRPVTVYIYKEY